MNIFCWVLLCITSGKSSALSPLEINLLSKDQGFTLDCMHFFAYTWVGCLFTLLYHSYPPNVLSWMPPLPTTFSPKGVLQYLSFDVTGLGLFDRLTTLLQAKMLLSYSVNWIPPLLNNLWSSEILWSQKANSCSWHQLCNLVLTSKINPFLVQPFFFTRRMKETPDRFYALKPYPQSEVVNLCMVNVFPGSDVPGQQRVIVQHLSIVPRNFGSEHLAISKPP